jgi:acylpyruvate hydrolase
MKIICIGLNYHDHIREFGGKVPDKPIFFLKADSSLVVNNKPFFLPDFSNAIHYEVEVVLKICKVGKNIETRFAQRYYNEITLGIDFTARDLQNECREKSLPWEISKAFDHSAPIGKFINKKEIPDLKKINFRLDLNGKTVQKGSTSDMIFTFDEVISYLSKFMTLKTGDLIFTGTPVGVGPVKINDRLEAFLEDKKLLDFKVK